MKTTRIIFKPLKENTSYEATLDTIEDILARESSNKQYNHDEIKSLINNAFEDGYNKAKQEVDREELHYKEILTHAINNITAKIEEIKPLISDINTKASQELLKFSFILVKKILGDFLDEHYQDILKLKIENCLKLITREPKLKIFISPEVEKFITEKIDEIRRATLFLGEIIILPDPNLHKLSCIVEWDDGFAKIDYNKLLAKIEEVVSLDVK